MQHHIQIYRNVQLKQGLRVFYHQQLFGGGGDQSKTKVGKQQQWQLTLSAQRCHSLCAARWSRRSGNTVEIITRHIALSTYLCLHQLTTYLSTKPRFTLRPTVFRDRPLTNSSMHNSVTILHTIELCNPFVLAHLCAHTFTQKILVNLFNAGTLFIIYKRLLLGDFDN